MQRHGSAGYQATQALEEESSRLKQIHAGKLPHQADSFKLKFPANFNLAFCSVRSPSELIAADLVVPSAYTAI